MLVTKSQYNSTLEHANYLSSSIYNIDPTLNASV